MSDSASRPSTRGRPGTEGTQESYVVGVELGEDVGLIDPSGSQEIPAANIVIQKRQKQSDQAAEASEPKDEDAPAELDTDEQASADITLEVSRDIDDESLLDDEAEEEEKRPTTHASSNRPITAGSYVVNIEMNPNPEYDTDSDQPGQLISPMINISPKKRVTVISDSPDPKHDLEFSDEEMKSQDHLQVGLTPEASKDDLEGSAEQRASASSLRPEDLIEVEGNGVEDLELAIMQNYKATNAQYCDEEFSAENHSLYKKEKVVPEYDRDAPCEKWVRPDELSHKPVVFANGISPGDVSQGALGDCWFLGAVCCLATYPELVERLFVNTESMNTAGFVTCQFFKNGEWKQVIVDTRIPYNAQYGAPIYGHCSDPNEMWLPLLEKAYAKLHRNYETLNGGSMTEGLVDLTGGSSIKYNMKDPEVWKLHESGELWQILLKYHNLKCLLGCAHSQVNEAGDQHEVMGTAGILNNHAYGIMDVREIDTLQLIRIRNPWGRGEWKSTFADEDEEWDRHPGLKAKLNYQFSNDGTWWMQYADWILHYNKLYICRIFPEKWQQYSIDGQWEGKTNGGPCPPSIDRDEEVSDVIKMDSDDLWFNNPQYRLTVKRRTQLFISLMQADEKTSNKPYVPVNFLVIKTKDRRNRIWEKDKDDVICEAAIGLQRLAQREITKEMFLEVPEGQKDAMFIIVPNIVLDPKESFDHKKRNQKGRQFWLRLFSQHPIDVSELPETVEVPTFKGEWDGNTAGGKRLLRSGIDNPLWCKNPQYFLNLYAPTSLKIILRKTPGKRKARTNCVGVVICKAPMPRGGTKKAVVQSSIVKKGQTKMAKELTKLEPPSLDILERKLQFIPGEWVNESGYYQEEYSCLYFKLEPTQGPFLVVPTLDEVEVQAGYTLQIYSNNPLQVCRLEDSRNVALSGEWSEGQAGGCHLYDRPYERKPDNITWGANPKFKLQFQTEGYVKARITLTRSEKHWKAKIARKTIGCMIGLYTFDGASRKITPEALMTEPKFVPMNEYHEILEENKANPNGYILMPTTYEPNITGPFVLSVSCDADFTLTPVQEAT